MCALFQRIAFDWHLQELYNSVLPIIELILVALVSAVLLRVKKISDVQISNSRKITEVRDNIRVLANGNSVHHNLTPTGTSDNPTLETIPQPHADETNGTLGRDAGSAPPISQ